MKVFVLKKTVNNKEEIIALFRNKEEAQKLKNRLEFISINDPNWWYETDALYRKCGGKTDKLNFMYSRNIPYYKIEDKESFEILERKINIIGEPIIRNQLIKGLYNQKYIECCIDDEKELCKQLKLENIKLKKEIIQLKRNKE